MLHPHATKFLQVIPLKIQQETAKPTVSCATSVVKIGEKSVKVFYVDSGLRDTKNDPICKRHRRRVILQLAGA